MISAIKGWVTALSTFGKVGVVTTAVVAGGITNAAIAQNTKVQQNKPKPGNSQVAQCTSKHSSTTSTEAMPFNKKTVDDPNTAKGKTYVKTDGVDGIKTITYDFTTYNPSGCHEDTKTVLHEETTKQPIDQVTAMGTYEAPQPTCTNGSYTNVDGATVCSPSSNPNGATARCVDGTYSYSLNHSGTCSHHRGVAEWL